MLNGSTVQLFYLNCFGKTFSFFSLDDWDGVFSVMGLLKINTPEIHHVGQY